MESAAIALCRSRMGELAGRHLSVVLHGRTKRLHIGSRADNTRDASKHHSSNQMSVRAFRQGAGMSQSQRLTLRDVRAAYRVLGECRDLADDPAAWRRRLCESLLGLLGGHVAIGGENAAFWTQIPRPLHHCDVGRWTEAERGRFLYYMSQQEFFGSPVYCAYEALPGPVRVRSRKAIHGAQEWRRSIDFNEFHRISGLDEYVLSFWTDPMNREGITDVISLHRPIGDRAFRRREVRLVELLHAEIGPMIGRQLSSAAAPSPSDLAPRVRQVLDCLLEGDSEKQIAQRLQLSRSTVHQYVGMIYRRFAVQSRSELLARWVRFVRTRRNR